MIETFKLFFSLNSPVIHIVILCYYLYIVLINSFNYFRHHTYQSLHEAIVIFVWLYINQKKVFIKTILIRIYIHIYFYILYTRIYTHTHIHFPYTVVFFESQIHSSAFKFLLYIGIFCFGHSLSYSSEQFYDCLFWLKRWLLSG